MYETMLYTIRNLRQFRETENIKKVALPKIGSGHETGPHHDKIYF